MSGNNNDANNKIEHYVIFGGGTARWWCGRNNGVQTTKVNHKIQDHHLQQKAVQATVGIVQATVVVVQATVVVVQATIAEGIQILEQFVSRERFEFFAYNLLGCMSPLFEQLGEIYALI